MSWPSGPTQVNSPSAHPGGYVISTGFERWIGFSNDPAEVDGWAAWVRIGYRGLYVSGPGSPHFQLIRE